MWCDSHIHIVGAVVRYPQLANRSGVMGLAEIATVRRLGAARGISRFVIVQPSFYGTDNSMLLHGLALLGDSARGVAVIDAASATADMLKDWHTRGVRGLRLNLYSPIGPEKSIERDFVALADIAQTMRWHVEVIAPIDTITTHAELLTGAKVPVVIDHYGVHGGSTPASAVGKRLLDLLKAPHLWIKLSAPYRVSANPLETTPDAGWLAAILEATPSRCVWGSDWPHTPAHDSTDGKYRPIDYAVLVDRFIVALKESALADTVMRHNPARLYGYPDSR